MITKIVLVFVGVCIIGVLFQLTIMKKLVVFSAVDGVVTDSGVPVVGAKVSREFLWSMKRETGSDTVETDTEGHFHFPAVTRRSWMAIFPHEPVVRQSIRINTDSGQYNAWTYFKRNYENNGELGRLIQLSCSLQNKEEAHPASYDTVFGMCSLN
jgi:hypothetical protein